MKKKIVIFTSVFLALAVILTSAVMYLTHMGTKGRITGLLYDENNVYENIWNMVVFEKLGVDTVLTTRSEGAYADYDLGEFQNIQIPEHGLIIAIHGDEMFLYMQKSNGEGGWLEGEYANYVYNRKNDTLYGNKSEEYLYKHFLSYYYTWIMAAHKYTERAPGHYTTYISGIVEKE